MEGYVPPSKQALIEALTLSQEILRNVELSELPLVSIALKASRLARILNEFDYQKIMEYEASGYPTTPTGVHPQIYNLAVLANRQYQEKKGKNSEIGNYIYLESVEELEQQISLSKIALDAARDPNVSVSSANPNQFVMPHTANWMERQRITENAQKAAKRLPERRSFIYSYVLKKCYELKYSGIADDIFSRIRERADSAIGALVPDAAQKLTAVYENLQSENKEDWANAVHSCRRILQDLSDALYPPREDKIVRSNGKDKTIKLGKDNYINRLMAYIEERSNSERFNEIIGSHLGFLGDRLDSVFQAAQKGSHDTVNREEADRYVVYTYMIVGDILSLAK